MCITVSSTQRFPYRVDGFGGKPVEIGNLQDASERDVSDTFHVVVRLTGLAFIQAARRDERGAFLDARMLGIPYVFLGAPEIELHALQDEWMFDGCVAHLAGERAFFFIWAEGFCKQVFVEYG